MARRKTNYALQAEQVRACRQRYARLLRSLRAIAPGEPLDLLAFNGGIRNFGEVSYIASQLVRRKGDRFTLSNVRRSGSLVLDSNIDAGTLTRNF